MEGKIVRVAELKNARTTIAGVEKKFQNLIEGSIQGIMVRRNFKVLFANQAMADTLGFDSIDDLIGADISETILTHQREEGIALYKRVMRGEPIKNPIESQLRRKDGSLIWVERIHTRVDWEGEPALLATTTEITKRKRAERALKRALAEVKILKNRLQAECIYLQEEIKTQHNFENVIGQSEILKKILHRLERVAATDATVLILGETGTGKELLARAVHNLSDRRDRPLVKVNCAALPANLIESELFGHERGAFTGALIQKIGRFELADGGTIFLDEIGELPLELQAKLLRVLQEGVVERIGNPKSVKVDVRIIAATNRDLQQAVQTGAFRDDLFYRLNVFPIESPPLRQRKEDIPLLVQHFVDKHAVRLGKKIDSISLQLFEALQAYPWPGNIRELENVVERAIILTNGPQLLIGEFELPNKSLPKSARLSDIERAHILTVLQDCGWKITGQHGAAKRLALPASTLRDRMRKLEISRPDKS